MVAILLGTENAAWVAEQSPQGVYRRALNWGIQLPFYLADNAPGYCCMSFTAENDKGLYRNCSVQSE